MSPQEDDIERADNRMLRSDAKRRPLLTDGDVGDNGAGFAHTVAVAEAAVLTAMTTSSGLSGSVVETPTGRPCSAGSPACSTDATKPSQWRQW